TLPATAAALAEGVVKAMFLSKLQVALAVAVLVGVVGTGAGVLGRYDFIDAAPQTEQGRAQGEATQAGGGGKEQVTAARVDDELSSEVMRLIHEYAAAQVQLQARRPKPLPLDHGQVVQQMVQSFQGMPPDERRRALRRFPDVVLRMQRA